MAEMYPGSPPWLEPLLNALRMQASKIRKTLILPLPDLPDGLRGEEEPARAVRAYFLQYIDTGRWPDASAELRGLILYSLDRALDLLTRLRRYPDFRHLPPQPRDKVLRWLLIDVPARHPLRRNPPGQSGPAR